MINPRLGLAGGRDHGAPEIAFRIDLLPAGRGGQDGDVDKDAVPVADDESVLPAMAAWTAWRENPSQSRASCEFAGMDRMM